MSSPAIVMVSKYVTSGTKAFGSYLKYMDRSEATRSKNFESYNAFNFDGYNNYMSNPLKSDGLFTEGKGYMTTDEIDRLKRLFSIAQEKESPMWQTVFSFDNDWLEKQGLYNAKTGYLDSKLIKESVSMSMSSMKKKMGLNDTFTWSASIHYNTDNIHVHVAGVEVISSREKINWEGVSQFKAKIPKRSMDLMKSTFINNMTDRDRQLSQISDLIRNRISKEIRSNGNNSGMYLKLKMNQLLKKLPEDKRLWKYNNSVIKPFKNEIDEINHLLIGHDESGAMEKLDKLLTDEMLFRKDLYGEGTKEFERFKDYKTNKYSELYSLMGNSLLRELAEGESDSKKEINETLVQPISNKLLKKIKVNNTKTLQEHLARMKFEQMQREAEYQVAMNAKQNNRGL